MAPKKKPSFLQRQRALRKQQQQNKSQSSKQLPPGKKGGDVTKPKPTKPTATSKPAPVQRVRVRDLGSTKPNQMGGGSQRSLPSGRSGGALARTARGTANVASQGVGMAGRVAGAFGTALAIPAAIKNIKDVAERNKRWNEYKERMGMNTPKTGTSNASSNRRRTGQNDSTLSVRTSPAGTRSGAAAGTRTRANQPATQSGSNWRSRVGSANVDDLRQGQNNAIRSYADKTPPSRPSPSPSRGSSTRPSSGTSSPSRPAPSAPRTRVPGASETYRDGGKGLYQGTQAYRDKVGGSGNPLLNRFRQDMGRDVASGSKGNSNYNKPEDKGQFVASDGRPYMGPGYGNNKSGSDKLRQAMEDQRKKREEDRKRLMASRKGTAFGGVS